MEATKRQSNFELLRIICMLMIIAGHLISCHNTSYSILDFDEIVKLMCMSFFCVAVNTFVLISGYWGIDYKTERLMRLIAQTFFYSVSLYGFSIFVGWHSSFSYKDIFSFFPILTKQYWFVTCYFVLYLIAPWLNKCVNSLNQKDYKRFLILFLLIIYVWPTLSYLFNAQQFIGDAGYGIINFIYLYFLGRYLRIYYKNIHSTLYYANGYVLFASILFLCQFIISYLLGFEYTSWFSYNTIFVLGGSVCLFLLFRQLQFSSSIINNLAKPCLAVYLIHKSPYIWSYFCELIGISNFHGLVYIIVILTLPFFIYLFCSVIEMIRARFMGQFEHKVYISIQAISNKIKN